MNSFDMSSLVVHDRNGKCAPEVKVTPIAVGCWWVNLDHLFVSGIVMYQGRFLCFGGPYGNATRCSLSPDVGRCRFAPQEWRLRNETTEINLSRAGASLTVKCPNLVHLDG